MTHTRYRTVKELFVAACEVEAHGRAAFVEHACGSDASLRSELERLLATCDDDAGFLESALGRESAAKSIPKQIGKYEVSRVIASGGMGTVFEAVQQNPRRAVAVKVLRFGLASGPAMQRFEYESQLLAQLRHPNIAQVFEAGTFETEAGVVPYFAMEFIADAKTITEYAWDNRLGTRQRLTLFVQVCRAVAHGHQKGIIHRDLKPDNILVDPGGAPKIIDFGVARSTDADVSATTLHTKVGDLIGTLQYMSPEQCKGDPHEIDTRTDVYSLGVLLFELLCGEMPYDVSCTPVYEATRRIREQPPTTLSSFDTSLRGDVETIVHKALDKDPNRRYRSAAAFADDVERYLKDEPIQARDPGILYRAHKFVRRHRAGVTIFVVSLLLIGALLLLSSKSKSERIVRQEKSEVQFDILLAAAGRSTKEERWDQARKKYLSALQLEPEDYGALGNLAIMCIKQYNSQSAPDLALLDEALQYCDRALVAHPNRSELWNIKGTLAKKTGELGEAIHAYKRATDLDPENHAALANLAVAHLLTGDIDAAEAELTDAVRTGEALQQSAEANETDFDIVYCALWRNLASFQLFRNDSRAAENVTKAISCDRSAPSAMLLRARVHMELAGFEDRTAASDAIRLADHLAREQDGKIKRVRALIHSRNGDWQSAVTSAESAIALNDMRTINEFILSIAHARHGYPSDAQAAFDRAMKHWPKDLASNGSIQASADRGVLWIDTADELHQLRIEAARLLGLEAQN